MNVDDDEYFPIDTGRNLIMGGIDKGIISERANVGLGNLSNDKEECGKNL